MNDRVMTPICFSVSASVFVGKFLNSSSSEKYSVFKYLEFLFVLDKRISSASVGVSVMLAIGAGGFEGFLFVVVLEDEVELAVLGLDCLDAVVGREELLEGGREDGDEEGELGVGLRADTRLRRVLGVVGRDLVRRVGVSERDPSEVSDRGEIGEMGGDGVLVGCTTGVIVRCVVGPLLRVDDFSLVLDGLLGVELIGVGCVGGGFFDGGTRLTCKGLL